MTDKYLWEHKEIQTKIFDIERHISQKCPIAFHASPYNLCFWLAHYLRLSEKTTPHAKKYMQQLNLELPIVTKNFKNVTRWETQTKISELFNIVSSGIFPSNTIQLTPDCSESPIIIETNKEDAHATVEAIACLATDLNKNGKTAEAQEVSALLQFAKGAGSETKKELISSAKQSLIVYPVMIVVGAGVTFIAPEVAAGLVTLFAIYKVSCTIISATINLAFMLEALYNDDYERAGRHFVQLGFDIWSFDCVAKSLRSLFKIKVFGSNEAFIPKFIQQIRVCTSKPARIKLNNIDTLINNLPDVLDKKAFKEAFDLFHKLPEALTNDCPFSKILLSHNTKTSVDRIANIKGAWYEIEKALKLYKQGIKIERIGIQYETSKGIKDFDIETPTTLIECKNIRWFDYSKIQILPQRTIDSIQILKDKINLGRTIAEDLMGKKFELHSKKPIPHVWREWLTNNNITFIEDN